MRTYRRWRQVRRFVRRNRSAHQQLRAKDIVDVASAFGAVWPRSSRLVRRRLLWLGHGLNGLDVTVRSVEHWRAAEFEFDSARNQLSLRPHIEDSGESHSLS